jgi:hypothetical protein
VGVQGGCEKWVRRVLSIREGDLLAHLKRVSFSHRLCDYDEVVMFA